MSNQLKNLEQEKDDLERLLRVGIVQVSPLFCSLIPTFLYASQSIFFLMFSHPRTQDQVYGLCYKALGSKVMETEWLMGLLGVRNTIKTEL